MGGCGELFRYRCWKPRFDTGRHSVGGIKKACFDSANPLRKGASRSFLRSLIKLNLSPQLKKLPKYMSQTLTSLFMKSPYGSFVNDFPTQTKKMETLLEKEARFFESVSFNEIYAVSYFIIHFSGQKLGLDTNSLRLCKTVVSKEADRNICLAFPVRNWFSCRLVRPSRSSATCSRHGM